MKEYMDMTGDNIDCDSKMTIEKEIGFQHFILENLIHHILVVLFISIAANFYFWQSSKIDKRRIESQSAQIEELKWSRNQNVR